MICRSGGIGRRARFKIECPQGVRVRVSPPAPKVRNYERSRNNNCPNIRFFWNATYNDFGFILLLYFLLIRPQNKRLKAHQELVNNLEIGDEVITSGGIVCTLVKLSDSYVIARTGNNQEIVIQRQQINSVLPKGTVKSLFE